MAGRVVVGTAGWSIPRAVTHHFPGDGTHLTRYGAVLGGAEVNTSFYRPHRPATYARWAASVPAGFRFAVKVPRTVTHEHKLRETTSLLERFLEESGGLGEERGPLLVQLPPSLAFERDVVADFFETLRACFAGHVVCEPRHATWFDPAVDRLLVEHEVARVAADPPRVPGADRPGGWTGLTYFRLHGSPRTYWSPYDDAALERLAAEIQVRARTGEVWCIFDNTASGAALQNAWDLTQRLSSAGETSPGER